MTTGRFRFPLRNLSAGRYCDFHAVNYYTRSTVSGLADGVRENAPVNDPGWDIYPPGIAECAKKMYRLLQLPIYITKTAPAPATTAAAAAICSTTCRRFATAACPQSATITGAFATTLSGWKAKARALASCTWTMPPSAEP